MAPVVREQPLADPVAGVSFVAGFVNTRARAGQIALMLMLSAPAFAAEQTVSGLSAAQMFEVARKAEAAGDAPTGETIYKALAKDPDIEVRNEARFRHGQALARQGKLADAAVLYRAILDEKPDAQRVRLELAAVLAQLGDMRGAGRAMRQAQAGGLPPEVAQLVSQFQGALRSMRPYGGSFELALAPSTNINRATTATTLDTIIAPFELSDDARAKSGVGVKLGGQGYLRLPLGKALRSTTRLSAQANLYRDGQFSDIIGSGETGLELVRKKGLFRMLGGRSYRWYGGDLYATTNTLSLGWQRPLGKRTQIELESGVGFSNYRSNNLQDGKLYDASVAVEQAFSKVAGARVALSAQRQTARDPGYATASGGVSLLGYRELGKTTLYATAALNRLEADKRLALYPRRRTEWSTRLGAGATFRQLKVAGFAPVLRVSYEHNASTIAIYDYKRFATELGISRAF